MFERHKESYITERYEILYLDRFDKSASYFYVCPYIFILSSYYNLLSIAGHSPFLF